ncbi:transposase [Mesorhizobium sp.]|uniref:transposase n=1 Tax=Mesorhizobium sp. TaxID=1871066 RepID=UPI003390691F
MPDDRSFHVLEAVASRLDYKSAASAAALVGGSEGTPVEESLKPGANVSAIARQAGLARSQLFGWRHKAMKSGAVRPQRDTARLGSRSRDSICVGVDRAGWRGHSRRCRYQ